MSNVAIRVEGLSKQYRIGARAASYRTLREALAETVLAPVRRLGGRRIAASEDQTVWALKDVSFEVHPGEVIGIIGRNGAGKSTLLKILSRITTPTEGYADVYGRVGSLLEVGTGFHPELTGRENIYLNGAILGMKRSEIRRKFDEIVAFAEVERFIDTPVKRYSSGMYLRLAFAVAAQMEPEILVVDEVLAVGDADFQKKCLGKMGDVAKGGRTVLFVSHNMGAISRLCGRTFLLSTGNVQVYKTADEAIGRYLQTGNAEFRGRADLTNAPGWEPNRRVIFTWISTHRLDGSQACEFSTGEGVIIRMGYRLAEAVSAAYMQVNLFDSMGERIMTVSNLHGARPCAISGEGVIECRLESVCLASGEYSLDIEIGRRFPYIEYLDYVPSAARVHIDLKDYLNGTELVRGQGIIAQKSRWTVCR